ncbi:aminopeptidase N-like [Toxorhynchites rutilus septentrionalis]|uniref:aminopeptidase N-like n=1 Tax=Toxorhynchites rutilus septentrionalis TaxID=329112 RepID=UPI002479EBFA|nr:aminopeptidase N-like [Toxorhynchites rutilus septentrionalis]
MGTNVVQSCILVLIASVAVSAISPLRERTSINLNSTHVSNRREIDRSYFLPTDTVPLKYFIHLITDVHNNNRTFQAMAEINFEVVQPTVNVTMHLQELDIQSTELLAVPTQSNDSELIDNPSFMIDTRIEHVVFICQRQLEAGRYILRVHYSGTMRNYQSGYLISSYRDDNDVVNYVGSTHFQATLARRVFPCYDEPDLKAPITLWVEHHKNYSAVANMPVETIQESEDYRITKFVPTPRISTYLLAFAVTNFKVKINGKNEILARPNVAEEMDYALEVGTKMLHALGNHTGVSYFEYMPKMTQIAIPDRGSGAMENWGLVTYGEPALLFNAKLNGYRSQKRVTTIIAHEFAHQWFGNLVSPKWWDYIWLNEGFAALYEYYATALAYPELRYWQLFKVEVLQRALGQDASESVRPMNHPAASQDEVWRLFDVIAYQKSASVLNMLREVIGIDNWTEGLNHYFKNRQLDSATPDDLYAGLERAIEGRNLIPEQFSLKKVMESWTNASGYPVLNVHRLYNAGSIILSQERFLADGRLPNDHVWYIPYNYANSSSPGDSKVQWLTEKAAKITTSTANNQWIVFNREQFGYYRVNYDQRNWELIIEALSTGPNNPIHHDNRAQLIDDAFHLARSESLDMAIVLRLLSCLRLEVAYVPWAAANNVLNYFYGKLRGTEHYLGFENFVSEIVSDVYDIFLVDDVTENEYTITKYFKQIIASWACRMGLKDCLSRMNARLKLEVETAMTVHPDVVATVYCYGLRNGTHGELLFLLEKLFSSKNQAQRSDIITALGCTKDAQSVRELLSVVQSTSRNFLSTERSQIVDAIVAGGREGIDVMVEYLMTVENAQSLKNTLGEETFSNIILNIAGHTNTVNERESLGKLLTGLKGIITEQTVEAAGLKPKANAGWFDSLEGLVTVEFFDRYANKVL